VGCCLEVNSVLQFAMDDISNLAEALKSVTGIKVNLGLAALVSGSLNAVGAYLKSSDWFPTRYIPYVVIVAGIFIYPALGDSFKPGDWVIGLATGLAAIGAHQGARTVKDTIQQNPVQPTQLDPDQKP